VTWRGGSNSASTDPAGTTTGSSACSTTTPKVSTGPCSSSSMVGTNPFRTTLAYADYAAVRRLGEEYRGRNPRSLA